jgi:hypothetical protein
MKWSRATMLANIKSPPSTAGLFSRKVWFCFGIFFALALSYELYRWFLGVGESSQIAIMAGMLFMVAFILARHPTVRAFFFFSYTGLLIVALLLMTFRFLRFIRII